MSRVDDVHAAIEGLHVSVDAINEELQLSRMRVAELNKVLDHQSEELRLYAPVVVAARACQSWLNNYPIAALVHSERQLLEALVNYDTAKLSAMRSKQ